MENKELQLKQVCKVRGSAKITVDFPMNIVDASQGEVGVSFHELKGKIESLGMKMKRIEDVKVRVFYEGDDDE